jgi:apolipoprotein N-acyltransferase
MRLRSGRTARRVTRCGAALVGGVLVALSVPPAGWWPLGIAGVGLVGALLAGESLRLRLLLGFVAGLGLYGITLAWMSEFNAIGAVLVMFLEAGFLALAAGATPPGRARVVGWPAAVLLSNGLRTIVPFGGLPMGGVDLGQAGGPLAPAARLGGPLLVSAVVAILGLAAEGAARLAWPRGRSRSALALMLGVTTVIGVALPAAGAAAPGGHSVGALRVDAVQGGGQRGLRAIYNPPERVFAAQVAASAGLAPGADLVLWPENVLSLDGPLAGSPQAAVVSGIASRLRTTLVAGVTEPVGESRFVNAAVVWGPDGRVVGRYDKVHRVPFGEYVPGRGLVSHLVNLNVIPRDAVSGHGSGALATPAGTFGVTISFEVFFSARARSAIRGGGTVLLVPTNDASYTTSQVPASELATARLRAWETGRDVVMAAPTGFSAVIDHLGRVRLRSRLGAAQVLVTTVEQRAGPTPYLRWGDGPWVVAAGLILAGAWLVGRPRRRLSPRRHRRTRTVESAALPHPQLDRAVNTSKP